MSPIIYSNYLDEALNTVTLETANYLSKLPAAQQTKEGIVEFVQKLKADPDGAKLLPNELIQIVNMRPEQVIYPEKMVYVDKLKHGKISCSSSLFAFLRGNAFSHLLTIILASRFIDHECKFQRTFSDVTIQRFSNKQNDLLRVTQNTD